jgi:hypothetical protein
MRALRWRNRFAAAIAIVGGCVLILAQYSLGATRWSDTHRRMVQVVGENPAVDMIFGAMVAIASLGGLAVIIGGILLAYGRIVPGKTLLLMGTGFGVVGYLIFLGTSLRAGTPPLVDSSMLALLGVGLAIAARTLARRRPLLGLRPL